MATDLTLNEYHQRRNALLAQILEAERNISRITNPDYTLLTVNELTLLRSYLESLNQQLVALNATWNLQQSKKEKT